MDLVAEHCSNLTRADIDGLMLSWTVGGYPSPNLELVRQFQSRPAPTMGEALRGLAESRYGAEAAEDVLAAWSAFSSAFGEYPFYGGFVYAGPAQCGPANLLYAEPTGYRATMVGFPYDDVQGWRGPYPADVLAGQFEKMAHGWLEGLSAFERALRKITTPQRHANADADFGVAQAAYLHFKSVANQIRFTLARNQLLSGSLSQIERQVRVEKIREILADEMANAERLFVLTRKDPRIGFEASNHYYYLPLDLVEKVVSCEYILNKWLVQQSLVKPKQAQ